MCGVIGVYGHDYVAQDAYDALITLQHRGQDATGIITYNGSFHVRKELGLVRDVYHTRHMKDLAGYAAVGHTRYATMGTISPEGCQPFLGQSPYGLVLAHNGNVFNSRELKEELFKKDHRLVNSDNDAEVLLHLLSKALTKQNADKIKPENIYKAVQSVYERAKGSYSVVSYIAKQGMLAFRDPHGIRPLVFGRRKNGLKYDYMFASESATLDIVGFELIGDVGAGEAVFIEEKTRKIYRKKLANKTWTPCIFEYIYFARPDSMLNGISVYKAQRRMGEGLAKKIKAAKLDLDVVMPVPDSSRTAALALADKLGIKYREGLVKNRYIGRTFIMPEQKIRTKSIRYKLNPMRLEIEGKKILLVDDSIVRGNTSREIVRMVREAGAKKVYFVSVSPPVKHPCLYGIDIPTEEELVAANHSIEEVRKFIGADALFYADLDDTFASCHEGNPKVKDFCMACFDGKYKTGDITKKILKENAESRLNDKFCDKFDDSFDNRFSFGRPDSADNEPPKSQMNLI
ncbi:MAG: amidophosphoribosyltransferase [Candidatus Gracilibacteria bacterium]|jgi:amidophosphoribosyltransferase